jgi:hypothetical protein
MSKFNLKETPIAAIVIGAFAVILIGMQFVSNMAVWVRQITLKVEHPTDSRFPEFENLLKAEVKNGRVDYRQTKNSPLLKAAVDKLETLNPDLIKDPKERTCFWINAYNLLVIKTIADRFPVSSIKQMGNDLHLRTFLVGGTAHSTQDIYLRELSPLLETEPKACFLICGGAIGHPDLLDHPVQAATLANDSEEAARRFISKPENVNYNSANKIVTLSPWFLWFEPAFIKKYGSSEKLIASYLDPEKREIFNRVAIVRSFGGKFDWRINNQESVKQ